LCLKKVQGQSSSFSYFRTDIPSSQYCPTHLQPGVVVAACAAADAVAAVLSGYARLVARLARLSLRLWPAPGCHWHASHSQRFATVETQTPRWSAWTGGALLPDRANRHPSSAHRGARSDHRQCAHSGLAPHRSCCRSLLPDSFVDAGRQVDLLVLLSLFLDDRGDVLL
jgi:hypothetical protein